MKTIIAGSRDITSKAVVQAAMNVADQDHGINITEGVSGAARGVDTIGADLCMESDIPVRYFPAAWNTYGKRAGYLRNERMAHYADALIAIWDGKSRGTKHMIDLARSEGLKVYVHSV